MAPSGHHYFCYCSLVPDKSILAEIYNPNDNEAKVTTKKVMILVFLSFFDNLRLLKELLSGPLGAINLYYCSPTLHEGISSANAPFKK